MCLWLLRLSSITLVLSLILILMEFVMPVSGNSAGIEYLVAVLDLVITLIVMRLVCSFSEQLPAQHRRPLASILVFKICIMLINIIEQLVSDGRSDSLRVLRITYPFVWVYVIIIIRRVRATPPPLDDQRMYSLMDGHAPQPVIPAAKQETELS